MTTLADSKGLPSDKEEEAKLANEADDNELKKKKSKKGKAAATKADELAREMEMEEEENDSCLNDVFKILKYIFFTDTGKIIKNANATNREMEDYDIPKLPPQFSILTVSQEMHKISMEWEKSTGPKQQPFWVNYLKLEKRSLILATILRFIADLLLIVIPLIVQVYESTVNYRRLPDKTFTIDLDSGTGFFMAGAGTLAFLLQFMFRQHSEKYIISSKFRIEQAIKNRLFSKLLLADYISIEKSDPNEMARILYFGLDSILGMLVILPGFISAPITILLGGFLVAQAHSSYFFLVAIAVFLMVMIYIMNKFNTKSVDYLEQYDKNQTLQSIKLEEFFDNITMIQTNSLGESLKEKFLTIRVQAKDTLQYMQVSQGVSEVILNLFPFVFVSMSMSIYHFLSVGPLSDSDSIRLMLCAIAPMAVPLRVFIDSFYKYKLFQSANNEIETLLSKLKQKSKPKGNEGKKRYAITMSNCDFIKDEVQRKSYDELINPKKGELDEKQRRYIIFRDRLRKNTFSYQVLGSEDYRKKQNDLYKRFMSAKSQSNVNLCLKNISFTVAAREKICIVGDENSGKHDLFLAIMRELIRSNGTFSLKGNTCYLDMNNPKFIRDTIKENILLGRPFVKEKYLRLLGLVDLRLSKYPLKDRTFVVEGQKNIAENDVSRILLARLLYSEADVVLLNNFFDLLSKDRQISTFEKVFTNELQSKTVIYSSSIVHLIKSADKVLVMREGYIVESDTYVNLMRNRKSHLYSNLMTDPAGNTNVFRKVLDQFHITARNRPGTEAAKEDPVPVEVTIKRNRANKIQQPSGGAAGPGETGGGNGQTEQGKEGVVPVATKAAEKTAKDIVETQNSTSLEDIPPAQRELTKLTKGIMYKSSMATRVAFVGRSWLVYYSYVLSVLLTSVVMGIGLILACFWGDDMYGLFSGFNSYLIVFDILVVVYIFLVILRDMSFTGKVIRNLNYLYNLVTNSLIDTQKEYLLQNPSARIMYLLTKTSSKLDKELLRSYSQYCDSINILLVFLGVLNYVMYIVMAVVSIVLMIVLLPIYSSFMKACVKLTVYTSNHSAELIEIYLSSFNFILPLRNHNIPEYFNNKFTDKANTVMRAKIRLEDDIYRWFFFRYLIFSSLLIMLLLFLPHILIQTVAGTFFIQEWQFKFTTASVCILLPVLLMFGKSMTEYVENMICTKSVLKYILELSKNSEDTSIIRRLCALPKAKKEDYDEEDVQETNLTNFILDNNVVSKALQPIAPKSKKVTPESKYAQKSRKVNTDEPTKPLLMLKNVTYVSKIGAYILDGINFKLYEAERIGLICELGSGKDFLINLLMTLIQKTDSPDVGVSSYEVMGKPVNLSTSSELRKNMMFLYAKPSLLMGTVRANIDPFGKYTDEEIIRTLHFLKLIKALQTYTSLTECDDIWLYLAHKTNQIDLTEINLDELKRRIDKKQETVKKAEDLPKKKKDGGKGKLDKGRSGTQFGFGSSMFGMGKSGIIADDNSSLPPLKGALNNGKPQNGAGKPAGTNIKEPSGDNKKNMLTVPGAAGGNPNSAEKAANPEVDNEVGDEENEMDKEEEPEVNQFNINDPLRNEVLQATQGLYAMSNEDKMKMARQCGEIMEEIKFVSRGRLLNQEELLENQTQDYFAEQFVTEFPIPMPIAERAKRLDEDLGDFDFDYDNHRLNFDDEKRLIKNILDMEVGQNGKNLNYDCRKIIMMAKAYLDKPPILILDEDSLFVVGVNRSFYIRQLFKNLKETGILSVIKDQREMHYYNSVILMKYGKVVEIGSPFELIENKKSKLYSTVSRDDIRTLKQLENKLERNVQTSRSRGDMMKKSTSTIHREVSVRTVSHHEGESNALTPYASNQNISVSPSKPRGLNSNFFQAFGLKEDNEDGQDADEASPRFKDGLQGSGIASPQPEASRTEATPKPPQQLTLGVKGDSKPSLRLNLPTDMLSK
jgi:ABC-type multidrug transport system fused ATPase/permease subunit